MYLPHCSLISVNNQTFYSQKQNMSSQLVQSGSKASLPGLLQHPSTSPPITSNNRFHWSPIHHTSIVMMPSLWWCWSWTGEWFVSYLVNIHCTDAVAENLYFSKDDEQREDFLQHQVESSQLQLQLPSSPNNIVKISILDIKIYIRSSINKCYDSPNMLQ